MKKRLTVLTAILLCLSLAVGFSACSGATGDEESESEFVVATLPVSDSIPVSESEIISFYNDIMTKLQSSDSFTAGNKPGVKTDESLKAGDLKILSFNPATGEATEDDSLKAHNKSAKAIKDRILSGIDTSVPVVPFGDVNASIASVIYPYDTAEMNLTADDITKAECSVDGNNLNIYFELTNNAETIDKVFGIRNKDALLAEMNEQCNAYAYINDYTVSYVDDAENNTHSTIFLSVEVEKQEDGTYRCTGRITSFDIKIICDVSANLTCAGSFADKGDIQVNFRLTDEKYYEFDWLGSSTWEPVSEQG